MEIDLTQFGDLMTPEEIQQIQGLDFQELEKLESKRDKWLKEKEVCFSGSEFYRLMTDEESRELSKGAKTYVIEKVLQSETEQDKRVLKTASIEWGNDNELEAVNEFIRKTGKVVYNIGEDQEFIKVSKHVGATPDGLIGKYEGLETKCPDSKTHYEWLRFLNNGNFKEYLKNYYWQIQGCLYVTGRKKWYFVSYDPRFKNIEKRLLIIEIERNEADITNLKRKLFLATKDLKEQLNELRN